MICDVCRDLAIITSSEQETEEKGERVQRAHLMSLSLFCGAFPEVPPLISFLCSLLATA